MIAKAAYFRAERRKFEPGHELEDWLAAELEVDRRLAQAAPRTATSAGLTGEREGLRGRTGVEKPRGGK